MPDEIKRADGALLQEIEKLKRAIEDGSLVSASRAQLERYVAMIARPEALPEFIPDRLSQTGETVRLLLLAKLSDESHARALSIARAALWVSLAALALAGFQVAHTLGWMG